MTLLAHILRLFLTAYRDAKDTPVPPAQPGVPMPKRAPNWWEMPFEADWQPGEWISLEHLTKYKGFGRGFHQSGELNKPKREIRLRGIRFERCDLDIKWLYSSFTDCEFIACRFNGSYLDFVKFSKCTFRQCNFTHCTFANCKFISGCTFEENSASAEEFVLKHTSIEASKFIGALTTNTLHIPPDAGTNAAYQVNKLSETKLGLAQRIYAATREENDVDLFFEAYRELILCSLDWHIAKHRYLPKSGKNLPQLERQFVYFWRTFPKKLERSVVSLSGYLSDWGRSLSKPIAVFLFLVTSFHYLYLAVEPDATIWTYSSVADRLLRAVDVTLVAGYTAHCAPEDPLPLRWCTAINMFAGLYWYSLIVPVLSRRLLR